MMLRNCEKDASFFLKIQNEFKELENMPHKDHDEEKLAKEVMQSLLNEFSMVKRKRQHRMALFFFFQ